jgi:hypothetical protein
MKSFKINDQVWRIGSKRGLMRLSSKGNWYYSKDIDVNNTVLRKILRYKRRLLQQQQQQHNNKTSTETKYEHDYNNDMKINMKRVDKQLKEFEQTTLYDENKFDLELTKCFDIIIKPAITALCKGVDMFQLDSDGEYIVHSVIGDNLGIVTSRMKRVCPIVCIRKYIYETDTKLERMLLDFIDDEDSRLRHGFINPITAAIQKLSARLGDRGFPSIALVRERLGHTQAESYRTDLEKLQSSPIDEFNIEPVFIKGNLMNNTTIMFILHNVSLMATGDPIEIMNVIERETKGRSLSRFGTY